MRRMLVIDPRGTVLYAFPVFETIAKGKLRSHMAEKRRQYCGWKIIETFEPGVYEGERMALCAETKTWRRIIQG